MELRRSGAAGGLSCVEYVEQLTMLLFLRMADQLTELPYNQKSSIPKELGWKSLLPLDGAIMETMEAQDPGGSKL